MQHVSMSKCREESDLGLCMTSAHAKRHFQVSTICPDETPVSRECGNFSICHIDHPTLGSPNPMKLSICEIDAVQFIKLSICQWHSSVSHDYLSPCNIQCTRVNLFILTKRQIDNFKFQSPVQWTAQKIRLIMCACLSVQILKCPPTSSSRWALTENFAVLSHGARPPSIRCGPLRRRVSSLNTEKWTLVRSWLIRVRLVHSWADRDHSKLRQGARRLARGGAGQGPWPPRCLCFRCIPFHHMLRCLPQPCDVKTTSLLSNASAVGRLGVLAGLDRSAGRISDRFLYIFEVFVFRVEPVPPHLFSKNSSWASSTKKVW